MGERSMEGHEMAHGQAGGWEALEAFGTLLGVLLLLSLLTLVAWGAYRLIGSLQIGGWVDPPKTY